MQVTRSASASRALMATVVAAAMADWVVTAVLARRNPATPVAMAGPAEMAAMPELGATPVLAVEAVWLEVLVTAATVGLAVQAIGVRMRHL